MRDQILKSVRVLAAVVPLIALAQPLAAQRRGSWEFTVGGGVVHTDRALAGYLGDQGFANGPTAGSWAPAFSGRVGYNVTEHWGFSIGAVDAKASGVNYFTPFVAATYTANLNARVSPFLTFGTQFTRITGNGFKVHPTWGTRLGLGVRKMISPSVALRLEGRMGMEHFEEIPSPKTAYTSIVTLGLSFFTAGRRAAAAVVSPGPCPVCPLPRVRVDTVWRTAMAPPPVTIVLRDTLVLEGLNFDFDSSALTPDSYRILDNVAHELLKPEWSSSRWEIAGHTSSIGSHEYNMSLSQRRAESVRSYLVSRGVANNRLTPRGYGEVNPMYPNDSEGRNWRNRRVELRRIKP